MCFAATVDMHSLKCASKEAFHSSPMREKGLKVFIDVLNDRSSGHFLKLGYFDVNTEAPPPFQ